MAPTNAESNACDIMAGPYLLLDNLGDYPIKQAQRYAGPKAITDQYFIIKMIKSTIDDPREGISSDVIMEYTISKNLEDVDGVIKQQGWLPDPENSDEEPIRFCFVLDCYFSYSFSIEYTAAMSLHNYVWDMNGLSENEALEIFHSILLLFKRLHDLDIVHQDVTLKHMILNKTTREVKLVDFSPSKSPKHDLAGASRFSEYFSPERISNSPFHGKQSDMWSLGVALYVMFYGRYPFKEEQPIGTCGLICRGEFSIPEESNISQASLRLLSSLLQVNPLERYTCNDALKAINAM